jgi:hypothetical protein
MRKTGTGSGGGTGMNKNVSPKVRIGPNSTNVINPKGVSQLGQKFGNPQAIEPIHSGTASQVPLGPTVALNSKSSPGQGRDIHRSGSQATTGTGGPARPDGGSFFPGFDGKK